MQLFSTSLMHISFSWLPLPDAILLPLFLSAPSVLRAGSENGARVSR
jgi:hypothetical protein